MTDEAQYPPPPGRDTLPARPPRPPLDSRPAGDSARATGRWRSNPRPTSNGGDSYRPDAVPRMDRARDFDRGYERHSGQDERGGDSYRPPDSRHSQDSSHQPAAFHPPQGDFTFRAPKPTGVQEISYNSYRPGDGQNTHADSNDVDMGYPGSSRNNRRDQRRDTGRRTRQDGRRDVRSTDDRRRGPRQSYRFQPSDRPMLHVRHGDGADVNFVDSERGITYRALEDLSDSDEADMDISGDEADEPSTKRARTAETHTEASNAPKWSNPDPYTVLPPPDTTQPRKKDVVQLIRKARVQSEKDTRKSLLADSAEFISCDFDDSDEDQNSRVPGSQAEGGLRYGGQTDSQLRQRQPVQPSTQSQFPLLPPPPQETGRPSRPSQRKENPPRPVRPAREQKLANDISVAVKSTRNSANVAGRAHPPGPTSPLPESRKRTRDGQLKAPPNPKLKKPSKAPAAGSMDFEWQPVKDEPPCPWFIVDHSATSTSAVRLHKEIIDFYEHIRPCDFETRIRQGLIDELKRLCRRWVKDIDVYAFGSFMSGLFLPNADMDLVICSDQFIEKRMPKYDYKGFLYRFRQFLVTNKCAYDNEIEVISRAKVPLVKYIERKTGLKMDISFERMDGINAIKTFQAWKEQYPAMPILVTLIKQFLLMRGLHEPVNGGIGGFSVICLVVSMLQVHPVVQSRSLVPEHHLGEMLLEFFDLYGNRFRYSDVAIRMNPPGYVSKLDGEHSIRYLNLDRLSIIDPNNPENDITGGASNTLMVKRAFSEAHATLHARVVDVLQNPALRTASILEVILGGNYSHFRLQREHLRYIDEHGGPPESPPRQKQPVN